MMDTALKIIFLLALAGMVAFVWAGVGALIWSIYCDIKKGRQQ
jgi:hypothetical protein